MDLAFDDLNLSDFWQNFQVDHMDPPVPDYKDFAPGEECNGEEEISGAEEPKVRRTRAVVVKSSFQRNKILLLIRGYFHFLFHQWMLNRRDCDAAVTVSHNGTYCIAERRHFHRSTYCSYIRSNGGVSSAGAYYYEVIVQNKGLCRAGWSREHSFPTAQNDNAIRMKKILDFPLGCDPVSKGDVIGCLIDFDVKKISWTKNGRPFGVDYPYGTDQPYFPTLVLHRASVYINFGAKPFAFPPEDDIAAICDADEDVITWNQIETKVRLIKRGKAKSFSGGFEMFANNDVGNFGSTFSDCESSEEEKTLIVSNKKERVRRVSKNNKSKARRKARKCAHSVCEDKFAPNWKNF